MLEAVVMKLEDTYSFWSNSEYHIFMKYMNGESDERVLFSTVSSRSFENIQIKNFLSLLSR